jgi:DNA-binding NarL/FixJ family response regulator
MTGAVLARELRHLRANIPIILCTGFSAAVHPENASALGVQAVLIKPVPVSELARAIQQVLAPTSKAV